MRSQIFSTILISSSILPTTSPRLRQFAEENWGTYPLFNLSHGIDTPTLIGPAIQDYNTLEGTTGPLEVHTSTFAMEYLCSSSPQRKSIGDLLISLTVADLVFIQAAWVCFTMLVLYYLRKQDSTADYCEGCLEKQHSDDQHSLLRASHRSNGSYSMLEDEPAANTAQAPWTPLVALHHSPSLSRPDSR